MLCRLIERFGQFWDMAPEEAYGDPEEVLREEIADFIAYRRKDEEPVREAGE